ncbi:hypothetical protein DPMN_154824 [Dreissena polymorpha]|uniref:Uncharacterized protein n=1 Tax=Dreissena polymorpha TaxID=45954 RepID=A0A9D4FMS3_DREPO|nr:hypothetical protein DPMN_154824 [Dreissena polymorpha]
MFLLRADLPHQFHILISDIDFQDVIGSGPSARSTRDAAGARQSQSRGGYKGHCQGKTVAVKSLGNCDNHNHVTLDNQSLNDCL